MNREYSETSGLRVLVVEDDETDLELLVLRLEREGFHPDWRSVDTEEDYRASLDGEYDIVISDWSLPRFSGIEALRMLRSRGRDTPFIIVSGQISEEKAIEALRCGANDYIMKDRMERLGQSVRNVLDQRSLRHEYLLSESARKASDERYRTSFQDSLAIKLILNHEDGGIIDANAAAVRFYGYPLSRLCRMNISDINHMDRGALLAEMASAYRQERNFFNFRHKLASGEIRDVEVYSSPVKVGNLTFLHSIIHDITERKRSDDILQANLRLLQVSAEVSLQDLIRISVDEAEKLSGSRTAFFRAIEDSGHKPGGDGTVVEGMSLRGLSTRTLGGSRGVGGEEACGDLDFTEIREEMLRERRSLIRNDRESLPRRSAGEGCYAPRLREMIVPVMRDDSVVAILGVGDKPEYYRENDALSLRMIASLIWDIVRTKTKDIAIRRSEEQMRSVMQATPEMVFTVNEETEIEFINRVPAGLTVAEALGTSVLSYTDPAYVETVRLAIESAFATGEPGRYRILARGAYDEPRWYDSALVPILSDDRVRSVVISSTDVTDQIRLHRELEKSEEDLREAYEATLDGWASALELREKETAGHSQRVVELSVRLARAMGFAERGIIDLRRGALLHDIGKMGIPDAILLKPGRLADEEMALIRRHPDMARDLLSDIRYLGEARDIPYCHHERWDGSGYPRGLKGDAIPLAARVFSIVDVWDALTHDRPYRRAMTRAAAIQCIRKESGSHFDPRVVDAFMRILSEQVGENSVR